jgi:hypothetical protein
MHKYAMTSFRFFLIAFALVCVFDGPAALAQTCEPTKPATDRGAITPNGPWIAYQCPESCNMSTPPVFLRWTEDPWLLDTIWVWCGAVNGNPGYEAAIPSNSSCWNCINGCAGDNCPPGELCIPRPNQWGSDCRRYACDDPNYELVENGVNGVPYCRRKVACPPSCTPATVTLDGPTRIRTGASCTWTGNAFNDTCNASAYTYNWYTGTFWLGSGQYYTGGRPSGVLIGSPWRLRVEVTYNGTWVGSKEIEVRESSTAPICFQ